MRPLVGWLAVLFWCAEDKRRCGPFSPPAGSDGGVVPEVVVCGKCSPLFAGCLCTLLFNAGGFHGRRLNAGCREVNAGWCIAWGCWMKGCKYSYFGKPPREKHRKRQKDIMC